jgi:6-phosphogluconolactonase
MKIEVLENDAAVAERAASIIAEAARKTAATRGRFAFAVSGGRTPWAMLSLFAAKLVPWGSVHVFQVDERVAPTGDPERNLTHLDESFVAHAPLRREQVHAMPVEASDLTAGAESYSAALQEFCGTPPALDLVHLGLGPDGHTASLVPNDPVLEVGDHLVGFTGVTRAIDE